MKKVKYDRQKKLHEQIEQAKILNKKKDKFKKKDAIMRILEGEITRILNEKNAINTITTTNITNITNTPKLNTSLDSMEQEVNDDIVENNELSGWLLKYGDALKDWKKRWCTIDDESFKVYSSPDNPRVFGAIKLSEWEFFPYSPEGEYLNTFYFKKGEQLYVLKANNNNELQKWINSIVRMMRIRKK